MAILRLFLIFDLLATVHDMGSISCTYTNMTSIRGHPSTYYGRLSNRNFALAVMSVTTGRQERLCKCLKSHCSALLGVDVITLTPNSISEASCIQHVKDIPPSTAVVCFVKACQIGN